MSAATWSGSTRTAGGSRKAFRQVFERNSSRHCQIRMQVDLNKCVYRSYPEGLLWCKDFDSQTNNDHFKTGETRKLSYFFFFAAAHEC